MKAIFIGLGHFGDALLATGRSGDCHFSDRTFRRLPFRRWDVSTGRFVDERFSDQSSTVFIKMSEDQAFFSLGQKKQGGE